MYGSRYGGMGMGSMGLGGYGMSGMGMGMGMGGYGGMGMGSMNYGGMGMGPSSMGMGSNSMNMATAAAVDANGNPVPAITAGPNAVHGASSSGDSKEALIAEQKRQRRMFLMEATMQIVGGAMQLLLQVVMGLREVAGIVIGIYSSYHMMKSFRHSIGYGGSPYEGGGMATDAMGNPLYNRAGGMGMAGSSGGAAYPGSVGAASSSGSSVGSGVLRALKILAGAAAMYSAAQVAIRAYSNARETRAAARRREEARMERKRLFRRAERRSAGFEGADVSDGYDSSTCSSCGSSEFNTDDDDDTIGPSEPRGRIRHRSDALPTPPVAAGGKSERRVYVALYDHESTGQNGDLVSFRAGDQFEIEDFNGNAWCDAVRLGDANRDKRILVPGNYLRPLQLQQKF